MMKKGFKYGVPILAGLLVLPVPLLGNFHIESAILISVVASFVAVIRACQYPQLTDRPEIHTPLTVLGYCYLFGLPLFVYAIFTGCFSINGLGFWILYPAPSVFFSYAIGRLLRKSDLPLARTIAVCILLFVSIGVWLIEFFHFPQVYFFNHIWGGWPGPIYDETVKVSWSLVLFRGLTLAWTAGFWWLPQVRHSTKARGIVLGCCLLLAAGYSQLPEIGIISPQNYLQRRLGAKKETAHFILYYDKPHYSKDEIRFIAKKHEFYYRQITDTLRLGSSDPTRKIESYLYANAWQKKALVGAKFTSYVPIWLDRDQLHVAKQQIEGSLKHELVHVLAKRFGNALFKGSWSIGLIEGLAVALAPNASPVSTINQIVASQKPYPTAKEMEEALSPLGFYGGRSVVNYTETGSFVQYLVLHYPIAMFKEAYKDGAISVAYHVSIKQLVRGWHRRLDSVSVDSTDRQAAGRLYRIPSLFEQECPHVLSAFASDWDRYRHFKAEKDTAAALKYLNKARDEAPENRAVKNRWAFLNLKTGHYKKVQQKAEKADTTVENLLLYADALAMGQKMNQAHSYITAAAQRLQQQPDSSLAAALHVRQNAGQWKYYRQILYLNKRLDDSTFAKEAYITQMRAIRQAMEKENWQLLWRYARVVENKKPDILYFDTQMTLIAWMAFKGRIKEAKQWLQKIKVLKLRPRYRERLEETARWIEFQHRLE